MAEGVLGLWRGASDTASDLNMYARTKMMNIMASNEFQRRLSGTGVESFACHPGIADSGIYAKMDTSLKWSAKVRASYMAIQTPQSAMSAISQIGTPLRSRLHHGAGHGHPPVPDLSVGGERRSEPPVLCHRTHTVRCGKMCPFSSTAGKEAYTVARSGCCGNRQRRTLLWAQQA